MHRAIEFFRHQVSKHGGYVYQYSADLTKREGEGSVGLNTAWIEPPGTPFVGAAYLKAYRRCGDPLLLDAAKEVARALVVGQLESGGWGNQIEFSDVSRRDIRYRFDTDLNREVIIQSGRKKRNTTTLDDNKSQSACHFLMSVDQELSFSDSKIHEATLYALNSFVKAQYPNGAWPQRYDQPSDQSLQNRTLKASIPEDWPRDYPAGKYASYYTLNDHSISDMIRLMLDAWFVYKNSDYLEAAKRGGDFLVLAQLPEPQPGWAQQYDKKMQPSWARKFEPPAVTGGESQAVMKTLMILYRRLIGHDESAQKYLMPLPSALRYYRDSLLPSGNLARFYELETNLPLYMTHDYQLTYDADDLPTHYRFIIRSNLDDLQREYDQLIGAKGIDPWQPPSISPTERSAALTKRVNAIIDAMDPRGAWVEAGKLKYHGEADNVHGMIKTTTFCKNLLTLAEWLGK